MGELRLVGGCVVEEESGVSISYQFRTFSMSWHS